MESSENQENQYDEISYFCLYIIKKVEVESIQKVFNDRKYLLPADRGNSKRGQV